MAGTHYSKNGGSSDHLCLPDNPQYYNSSNQAGQNRSRLHGTEYEDSVRGANDYNVPCAVCFVATHTASLMIPARFVCPRNWTREYFGYLMTEADDYSDHHRSSYRCVDYDYQTIPGSAMNTDGALLYHVEATCNGLDCPPYNPENVLSCVVCTYGPPLRLPEPLGDK